MSIHVGNETLFRKFSEKLFDGLVHELAENDRIDFRYWTSESDDKAALMCIELDSQVTNGIEIIEHDNRHQIRSLDKHELMLAIETYMAMGFTETTANYSKENEQDD